MTHQELYISACENLDIPVSVAKRQGLTLDTLYTLLKRDYDKECEYYEPD